MISDERLEIEIEKREYDLKRRAIELEARLRSGLKTTTEPKMTKTSLSKRRTFIDERTGVVWKIREHSAMNGHYVVQTADTDACYIRVDGKMRYVVMHSNDFASVKHFAYDTTEDCAKGISYLMLEHHGKK